MLESALDSNSSVPEGLNIMPPTLNFGVSSINPSMGLSLQLPMPPPWSNNDFQNTGLPNSSLTAAKENGHHPIGQMSVFAEHFTVRGMEAGLSRPFIPSSSLSNNNGSGILPVPHGFSNGQEVDESSRIRAMQMSRSHEMVMSGFPPENSYPVTTFSNLSYGPGAENMYVQIADSQTGYMDGELRDEQSATFAMYRFKVEKCSKQFVHDWKECPYAHEGETARRRHPSTHSCQPCPDFKNSKTCARFVPKFTIEFFIGADLLLLCRGNMCPMAHGPWEAGLHPDAYRTNLCAYGHECKRRMCFFAHDNSELRTAASSQLAHQSGGVLNHGLTNHAQGPRLPAVENGIRAVLPMNHGPGSEAGSKRAAASVGWSQTSAMRSGDNQPQFPPSVRDDFGEISGRFRQMALEADSVDSEASYDAVIHSQIVGNTQKPSMSEFQHFEVFDCQGLNGSLQAEVENESRHPSVQNKKRADARLTFRPSVPPISEDASNFGGKGLRSGEFHSALVVPSVMPPISEDTSSFGAKSGRQPDEYHSALREGDSSMVTSAPELLTMRVEKPMGVKRNLQVDIPAQTRVSVPPKVSPTESMLKQDTSWVDKLLESPIEAAHHFNTRVKFPAP